MASAAGGAGGGAGAASSTSVAPSSSSSSERERIQVGVRIRPLNEREAKAGHFVQWSAVGKRKRVLGQQHTPRFVLFADTMSCLHITDSLPGHLAQLDSSGNELDNTRRRFGEWL